MDTFSTLPCVSCNPCLHGLSASWWHGCKRRPFHPPVLHPRCAPARRRRRGSTARPAPAAACTRPSAARPLQQAGQPSSRSVTIFACPIPGPCRCRPGCWMHLPHHTFCSQGTCFHPVSTPHHLCAPPAGAAARRRPPAGCSAGSRTAPAGCPQTRGPGGRGGAGARIVSMPNKVCHTTGTGHARAGTPPWLGRTRGAMEWKSRLARLASRQAS